MKKLILIFLILLSRGVYSQLAPSTIGQIYNFTVGDTLEYSFSSIQAIYNCGPSGLILDVIKSYTRTNDSIIYVVERLSSVAEYPCPNYNPPYGVFLTRQLLYKSWLLLILVFISESEFAPGLHLFAMIVHILPAAVILLDKK